MCYPKVILNISCRPMYACLCVCVCVFVYVCECKVEREKGVNVVGFTPILLSLTNMLRVCLYRKGTMEGEKRRAGNVIFSFIFCIHLLGQLHIFCGVFVVMVSV